MKILEKNPEKISFEAEIDISLANAIRRSVNNIPILAIDDVDIYRNDSALYDEVITHRLGLLPIKNEKLTEFSVCSCKGNGCSKCTIELKLNVEGREVLSLDLGNEIVYEDMPIVFLEEEQGLELVAKARIGRGKTHAKFTPGLFFYREGVKILISKDAMKNKEIAEDFPDFFEFNEELNVKNEWKCDLDQMDFEEFKGIEVRPTGNLIISIESWGQMKPEEIFVEAIKALKEDLKSVEKEF